MNPEDYLYHPPKIRIDSIQSLQDSLDEASQWWDRFMEHEFNVTRSWIGPVMDEYRSSKSAATQALQSEHPFFRYGGLYVLLYHWEKSADISAICEIKAVDDPYDPVKQLAIMYISDYYRGTGEHRVASLLAKLVVSDLEHNEIRAAAYCGMLLILGFKSTSIWKTIEFRFPRDVNWKLVRQYAVD